MRLEDRLDGQASFRSWRSRLVLILEDNDILNYVKDVVPEPNDNAGKATHRKNLIKAKRILMDYVKDHLIPNICDLDTTKEIFECLINLFGSNYSNMKSET